MFICYLLLHIKLLQSLVALDNPHLLSYGACGSGILERLTDFSSSRNHTGLRSRCQPRQDSIPSSLRSCWQDSIPHEFLHLKLQFLAAGWLKATFSSLACGSLHKAAQNMAACHPSHREGRLKGRVWARWRSVFQHLISYHHFCCILFIRS